MKKQLLAIFIVAAVGACGGPTGQPPAQQSSEGAADTPAGSVAAPEGAPGAATGSGASGAAPGAASPSPGMSSAAADGGNAPAPAGPVMMEMDVPSGTDLVLTLETAVSSDTAKPEQTVRATVAKPIVIAGMTVIPEGAPVTGTVVAAERSGRVKGRASIAIRFDEVTVAKTPYKIRTARIARQAETTKGDDAKKIGIGAGVGTAIGAIAGGKKGAAIGAAVGGGAGTGAVLATRGDEVTIPAGTTLKTTIEETVKINAEM
jgi:hypothetical protein